MENEVINYTTLLNTLITNTGNLVEVVDHLQNIFYVLIVLMGVNVCLLFKR